MVLLALCGSMPRGVYLGPIFVTSALHTRLSAELPIDMSSVFQVVCLSPYVSESSNPANDALLSPCRLRVLWLGRPGHLHANGHPNGGPWRQFSVQPAVGMGAKRMGRSFTPELGWRDKFWLVQATLATPD